MVLRRRVRGACPDINSSIQDGRVHQGGNHDVVVTIGACAKSHDGVGPDVQFRCLGGAGQGRLYDA